MLRKYLRPVESYAIYVDVTAELLSVYLIPEKFYDALWFSL